MALERLTKDEVIDDLHWLESSDSPEMLERKRIARERLQKKRSRRKRPTELIQAERQLRPVERLYARLLVHSVTIKEANERMAAAGYTFSDDTLRKWRQKPDFVAAQSAIQDYALQTMGLSKEKVLMDAERIKELALEETDILYKGEPTGYKERQLGAALRALELQGKGVGIHDRDPTNVVVNLDIDFSGRQKDVVIEGELGEESG